jgi:predicted ATPase
MSIDDEQLEIETVTDGDRALDLFVDRVGFTRLLAEQLNDPVSGQILYFYGDGGNGKSLLLKYLRQKICKRFLPHVW